MSTFIWQLPPAIPTAPAPAPSISSTDSVSVGLSRLPQQFKDRPNIIAFLSAILAPFGDLDQAIADCINNRSIANGTGTQLDVIGSIVGQSRAGMSDADYRRILYARVATNKSSGTPAELVNIARLVVGDSTVTLRYDNTGIAAYTIHASGNVITEGVAALVIPFLQQASVSGVKAFFHFSTFAPSTTFQFPAAFTTLSAPATAGDTVLHVVSTAGFTAPGTVIVDEGLATQENFAYASTTGTTFVGSTPLSNNHVGPSGSAGGAAVQPYVAGQGFYFATLMGGVIIGGKLSDVAVYP